ncbi:MAG: endonuclease III [Candidatus Promineifilaceae bacterium]|nr:endonuclease III [Candidatus Promineifilaceae bacterium]
MAKNDGDPFPIDDVIERVRRAVEPFPKAALFELAEEGHDSPFELLVACIISIRTRDETMYPTAVRFFEQARTPSAVSKMTPEGIDEIIQTSSFHERKAQQIHDIARTIVDEHDGQLPCEEDVLLSFHGVGPKCANLVLGIACHQEFIGVDVHVHRITNRWGYVDTKRPEQTMVALEEELPRQYWLDINRLLVPFGKHICTGRRPHCSACPILDPCAQKGVTDYR